VKDRDGQSWIHGRLDVEAHLIHLTKNWMVGCDVTNVFDGTVLVTAKYAVIAS
jgi:hypothetical protein